MSLSTILRYFYTVRYLKSKQFFFRLFYKLFKGLPSKNLISVKIRNSRGQTQKFLFREGCLVGPREFFLLNKKGGLDYLGWQGEEMSRLWRYNQHYFDFLNSEQSLNHKNWNIGLLLDWLRNNKPAKGVGWEPYPTSLRIVNWIKWSLSGNKLPDECIKSLAVQTAWLCSRVEFHILGNHLFANAKGLVFAGLFFEGEKAAKWLEKGLNIISLELNEQILSDGGNFELSPMYHAIFLEDLLDLINIAQAFPKQINTRMLDIWISKSGDMINWLKTMSHPDGEIALFNDSAFKVASKPKYLFEYANTLSVAMKFVKDNPNIIHLEESGYLRVDKSNLTLIMDVGKVGPDYLPAHAHADTLSFELSLFGMRLFVNGGTSEYGSGEIRNYERSTAAHNTVVVDNENSSEVWAEFRVARRAYPIGLKIDQSEDLINIECSHNGYERLRKGLIHTRSWKIFKNCLHISDLIEGSHSNAFAYYHLSPDIKILSTEADKITLLMKNEEKIYLKYFGTSLEIIDGFYASEFGKRTSNKFLKLGLDKLDGSTLQVNWDL